MKNGFIKISAVVIGITATALAGVLILDNRTEATSANYSAIVEEYVAETSAEETVIEVTTTEEASTEEVTTTEEATTEEVTTVEETTTEEVTTTEEATTEEVTTEEVTTTEEATTEEVTTTEAPVTTAATEAATEAPAASTITDVTFKNGADGSEASYANLDEAKKALAGIDTLSDKEAKAAAKANESTYAAQVEELLDLINAYRTESGLSKVTLQDNLTDAAMVRAAESAYANWNLTGYENGNKRHIRPNFKKASTIGADYGISGTFAEVYARYFDDAAGTLEGWQASSAHNAVLVGNYTTVGIGIAQAANGDMYWIAIFN